MKLAWIGGIGGDIAQLSPSGDWAQIAKESYNAVAQFLRAVPNFKSGQYYDADAGKIFAINPTTQVWEMVPSSGGTATPPPVTSPVVPTPRPDAPPGYQVHEASQTYWDPNAWDAENKVLGKWVPFGTPPQPTPQPTPVDPNKQRLADEAAAAKLERDRLAAEKAERDRLAEEAVRDAAAWAKGERDRLAAEKADAERKSQQKAKMLAAQKGLQQSPWGEDFARIFPQSAWNIAYGLPAMGRNPYQEWQAGQVGPAYATHVAGNWLPKATSTPTAFDPMSGGWGQNALKILRNMRGQTEDVQNTWIEDISQKEGAGAGSPALSLLLAQALGR